MPGYSTKFIKSLIRRKIGAWIKTIEDAELRKACEDSVIVTGGCIASLLLGEHVSDFDVYFDDLDVTKRVADYYVARWDKIQREKGSTNRPEMVVETLTDIRGKDRVRIKVQSAGVASETEKPEDYQYFESQPDAAGEDYLAEVFDSEAKRTEIEQHLGLAPKELTQFSTKEEKQDAAKRVEAKKAENNSYEPKFLSSNAISLGGNIQLILRFYGDPAEVHSTFDFAHATNYWVCKTGELVLQSRAMQSLLTKNLVYQGSFYPVATLFRVRKFVQRGWKINAGQMLKVIMQVSELNLKDYNVLEDQLTGVDVAYFEQLIDRLKAKNAEEVDASYLAELIDNLFGE